MKSEINNSKASAKAKGQRSRFYYKAEEYDSLDQVELAPKEKSVKESVKQETIKQSAKKSKKAVTK